ncbi:MAG: efflux RND transporter periplasmic adaptor subunit [Rhodospirillales bacterium]|nr:efflux RND transporter periplasmic adaptor subunit [Rhodospirillales bacterium]
MWVFAAVLIVTLGAAWELTSETAGEYFAMYVIEPVDLGASKRVPDSLDSGLNQGTSTNTVESDSANVLLSGITTAPAAKPAQELQATGQSAQPATEQSSSEPIRENETKMAALSAVAPEADNASLSYESLLGLMGDTPQRRLDGSVFLPITTQRVFGLRTVVGDRIRMPSTVELPGRIVPNPGSHTLLQVKYDGIIEAVKGRFPFIGQRVRRGELLAYLRPTNSHMDEARLAESIQQLTNQIDLSRKRMARLEEVVYVRYRTSKIEELRVEIVGLQRQQEVLQQSIDRRYEIRAMTKGIVSHVEAAVGQHLNEGATVFEVVDPTRLWVEALAYAPGTAEQIVQASAITPDNRVLKLRFLGGGLSLINQAVPLRFEILHPMPGLSVDNPVTVVVQKNAGEIEGIRIPRSSVVRTSDGRDIVWERRTAERFVSHQVSVLPIDADHVLVTSALDRSTRIVTDGTAVLDQVR